MAGDELVFDHVGIPTDEPQADEQFVEETRVWVTNPRRHTYRVEYLRFEPDSPVAEVARTLPHVAYRVRDLEPWLQGAEIVIQPFVVKNWATIAYVLKHGHCIEYMQFKGDPARWFTDL